MCVVFVDVVCAVKVGVGCCGGMSLVRVSAMTNITIVAVGGCVDLMFKTQRQQAHTNNHKHTLNTNTHTYMRDKNTLSSTTMS